MNKKLLLLGIGIVAVLAVACKAKNTEKEVLNSDNTETESKTESTDSQTDSENTAEDVLEPSDTEVSEDEESSEESDSTEEERNLNYKDVDIKVPSIHED